MLKIPAFKHPSNASLVTTFKQPNVEETLSFLDLNPDLEEKITTDYLNTILVETTAHKNTAKWTAGDRRTALWWIFINIMPESELTFSYQCEHCNSVHIEDINLMMLDEEVTTHKKLPELTTKMSFNGRIMSVTAKPLDGEAAAMLEDYRLDLLEALEQEDELQAQSIRANMKVLDVALSVDVEQLDIDQKVKLINTLTIPEVMKLFAFVESAKQELHHGLHTQLTDGKNQIVSPPLLCQSDDNKEGVSSRLLINFRSLDFIPAFWFKVTNDTCS